ncbi:MAG TPA: TatD family deoxyribonuclease [Proteobacteria bacterium]|nr:TatD family deoxyribonuclease [Pseudomonadota bacterium]
MYIDTHAHLDMYDSASDQAQVVSRAHAARVRQIITIGINLPSSGQAVAIAEQYEGVFAATGIHPHDAKGATSETYDGLRHLAKSPCVVAVGEIGLDFFKEYSPRREQEICLREQIQLARELRLPLIIHDRDAHDEIIRILREEKAEDVGGVFHCFSGNYTFGRKCLDMGFHISIAGVVTFPKAAILRDVVKNVPMDRLLIETDAPFLAPVPYRGKRNEPAYVVHVARKLADIKGCSVIEVAQWTRENAQALFKLPPL